MWATGNQHELVFHLGGVVSIGLGDGGQAFDAADGMLDPDSDPDTGAPGWVGLKAKTRRPASVSNRLLWVWRFFTTIVALLSTCVLWASNRAFRAIEP